MAIGHLPKCVALVFVGLAAAIATAAEPAKVPREGYKAPDFTLDTFDGKPVTLSKLLSRSSVVLVVLRGYPGYQCPLCSLQVGDFLNRADKFAKANAQVLLVYPGPAADLEKRAVEFLKNRKLPEHFSLVVDPDYQFTNAYGLRWDAPNETAYPATFVIDRQATIRLVKVSKTHGDRVKADETLKVLPAAD
jgi:peroxiredoxin